MGWTETTYLSSRKCWLAIRRHSYPFQMTDMSVYSNCAAARIPTDGPKPTLLGLPEGLLPGGDVKGPLPAQASIPIFDPSRTLPSFLSTARYGKVASTFQERPVIIRFVLPTLAVQTST